LFRFGVVEQEREALAVPTRQSVKHDDYNLTRVLLAQQFNPGIIDAAI